MTASQSSCPRCQQTIDRGTAYLRVYIRGDNDQEAYARVHLDCPPAEKPNLAASTSAATLNGGGVDGQDVEVVMQSPLSGVAGAFDFAVTKALLRRQARKARRSRQ